MSEFIPAGSPCFQLEKAIEHPFVVGDIVTRKGSDEQEVIGVNWAGDLIEVRCIKAPAAYDDPWCKVGDVESNLARRYDHARRDRNLRLCAGVRHRPVPAHEGVRSGVGGEFWRAYH